MYVAEARGQEDARKYLKTAESFFARPKTFTPVKPLTLKPGQSQTVSLLVSDDLASAKTHGRRAEVTLRIYALLSGGKGDLVVRFNDRLLTNASANGDRIDCGVDSEIVRKGFNQIVIARGTHADQDPVLRDLQLWIRYHQAK